MGHKFHTQIHGGEPKYIVGNPKRPPRRGEAGRGHGAAFSFFEGWPGHHVFGLRAMFWVPHNPFGSPTMHLNLQFLVKNHSDGNRGIPGRGLSVSRKLPGILGPI